MPPKKVLHFLLIALLGLDSLMSLRYFIICALFNFLEFPLLGVLFAGLLED